MTFPSWEYLSAEQNDSALAGSWASETATIDLFMVGAVHTNRGAVSWLVWDLSRDVAGDAPCVFETDTYECARAWISKKTAKELNDA